MGRVLAFLYGVVSYVIFFGAFCYAIGFVENVLVPKSIDSGTEGDLVPSIIVNALLLGLFAVQHSVMARPTFKKAWTKVIPVSIERSTFVLLSSLILILLYQQWRPLTGEVWTVANETGRIALQAISYFGWAMVLISTFLINHFDLFGLRQVYLNLQGKEYTALPFRTIGFYKYMRHPLMTGFLIAFWSTPDMTVGHLLFAGATTGFILIALQLEERNLIDFHGDAYKDYKRRVSMLIPMPAKK